MSNLASYIYFFLTDKENHCLQEALAMSNTALYLLMCLTFYKI